jgi:hypothetical protein
MAPITIYELCEIAGEAMELSTEPVTSPWSGHLDGGLACRLGFRPEVRIVHQAAQDGAL